MTALEHNTSTPTTDFTEEHVATLRALPDPGGSPSGRVALRAADLVDRGLAGHPILGDLQHAGLAHGRRGWWRKSRDGVLYLRDLDS